MAEKSSTVLTDDLRDLIKTARKHVGLSQRQAAKAARITEVWWQRVESGTTSQADADTVAQMCYAVNVSPEQLDAIGQEHLSGLVAKWRSLLQPTTNATEQAIQQLPGASEAEKLALISFLRHMRGVATTGTGVASAQ